MKFVLGIHSKFKLRRCFIDHGSDAKLFSVSLKWSPDGNTRSICTFELIDAPITYGSLHDQDSLLCQSLVYCVDESPAVFQFIFRFCIIQNEVEIIHKLVGGAASNIGTLLYPSVKVHLHSFCIYHKAAVHSSSVMKKLKCARIFMYTVLKHWY